MSENIFGINLIGFATGNLGLGTCMRQFAHALLNRNIPLRIFDLDIGGGRSKFDTSLSHLEVKHASELPFPINLYIFGITGITSFALYPPLDLNTKDRLNVAFIWWELPHLLDYWIEAARAFDVLIAGTEFIQEILANNIPGIPVLLARHPIHITKDVKPDRVRFGLPSEPLLIYTGFEPSSSVSRKNPFASISAFQKAFSDQSNCHLVIKLNNPTVQGEGKALLDKMYVQIENDSRIHVIKDSLPYTELLSLYASCDIFLSLHRSEGLGLIPLEAMHLGKVVVATGWSGNMSYMTHSSACLVTYDFLPIPNNAYVYGFNELGIKSYWAEPNVDHAAKWLTKLASDASLRSSIGKKAAQRADQYEKLASSLGFIDELKAILENKDIIPSKDRQIIFKRILKAKRQAEIKKLNPIARYLAIISDTTYEFLNKYLLWRFNKQ